MEKILMALEGPMPCKEVLAFGIYLSRLTHSRITGIFLENQPEDERTVVKNRYDGTYIEREVDQQSKARLEKMRGIEQGVEQFKSYYANHDIPTAVHRDKGIPVAEMLQETRYADLVVVDAGYSCRRDFERIPTAFVEDMLTKAECPVVIAPGNFEGVDEIVFAWDGSRSATFAIKLFTYLFPRLSDKKATIVHVKEGGNVKEAGKSQLQEWMEHHYTDIRWEELQGAADTALLGYFLKKKNVFIVFGAYGRNLLSRIFQRSHVEPVIKTVTQPIFIAHY